MNAHLRFQTINAVFLFKYTYFIMNYDDEPYFRSAFTYIFILLLYVLYIRMELSLKFAHYININTYNAQWFNDTVNYLLWFDLMFNYYSTTEYCYILFIHSFLWTYSYLVIIILSRLSILNIYIYHLQQNSNENI